MGTGRLLIHLRTLGICMVHLVLNLSDASIKVVQVTHHFPPLQGVWSLKIRFIIDIFRARF